MRLSRLYTVTGEMAVKEPFRKVQRVTKQAEEARRSFSECLEAAGFHGERIVVRRFGKEIAAIVSIADLKKIEASA